ncbi:MAG: asparagine--tRNA ligase [Candidatus Thermoplasmatota archaeon]|nr:asparagine--tRNA ligase [Candidatus Thermoplasmatota archaeon]
MQNIKDVLNLESVGKTVHLRGWVYRIRTSGKLTFIILRDSSGMVQLLSSARSLKEDEHKELSSLVIESSMEATGVIREDKRAVTGYEVELSSYKIYQRNDNFPISRDLGEEFLLDNRHLWLRSREFSAVLKIRSTIFKAFTDFYYENGFYQVQPPIMVSTATEGGSTLFKVPFFGDEVSLSQSSQFYLETFIFSLEKVFTIAPSFRAEKSRTRRHLTEYWHAEAEVAWVDNEGMMEIEERMIEYVVSSVVRENEEELRLLGRDVEFLKNIKAPFPRIRYGRLMEMAQEWGLNLKYGDDLGADEEREITVHFDKPVFVTHYPSSLKTFYHRPDPDNPDEILCHDLLAPEGYGEIIGGGERIWDLDLLKKRMVDYNLNTEDYYWYLDLRKYGSIPHSGFGLGLDRLAMWIMHLDNIREAIPFPRTIRRTKP